MTFNKSLLPIAVATLLASSAALAETPNYTYVEAGGFQMNLDDVPVDPTGYYIVGSAEIGAGGVFIHGGYLDGDDSYQGIDFDVSQTNIGLGYKAEISRDSTWHVFADWVEPEVEVEGDKFDESGYLLGLGARGFIAENWELGGNVVYADVEEEDGFGGEVELIFYFVDRIGVRLGGEVDEDSNTAVTLGLRVEF